MNALDFAVVFFKLQGESHKKHVICFNLISVNNINTRIRKMYALIDLF